MSLSSQPLIGREIDGYRIEALLGHGGMAQVYRGLDIALQRPVAIKVILPEERDNSSYEERFRREARAVASLRHPNIVGVYRFGHVDDLYYMAMDYIDGADLAWVLRQYRDAASLMPYNNLLDIVTQVATALDHAHRKGVIHRDIKPSNIMIDQSGQVFLTDFGLALVAAEGTRGGVFGSPHYIAPEQAVSSAHVVPQSDLYSLGVIIYEMLTGSVPFRQGTAMQVAMAHISDPPPSPQATNPNVHPVFSPVLERMLAKKPDDRLSSGAKMVTALRTAIKTARQDHAHTRQAGLSTRSPAELINQHRQDTTVDHAPASTSSNESILVSTSAPPHTSATQLIGRRTPLLRFMLIAGIIAAVVLGWQVNLTGNRGAAESAGTVPATLFIEGPVEQLETGIIQVYDIEFLLADGVTLPDGLTIGTVIRLEGQHTVEDGVLTLTRIISIEAQEHEP